LRDCGVNRIITENKKKKYICIEVYWRGGKHYFVEPDIDEISLRLGYYSLVSSQCPVRII